MVVEKAGDDPLPELRVNDVLLYLAIHGFDYHLNHDAPVHRSFLLLHDHSQFLLAFMEDKERSQGFCIPADEEAELCEDSDPDIVGADSQRVVFIIAFQDSMHKAIPLWLHVGCGAYGGVDDVLSVFVCFWTCATQELQ